MKQFILMNAEENRVQIESKHLPMVLSGDLSSTYVSGFTPKIYSSYWKAKWVSLWYNVHVVSLSQEKEADYYVYTWLLHVELGRVFKVWKNTCRTIPNDSSIDFGSGGIMIKGLGYYPQEDFLPFNFQEGNK